MATQHLERNTSYITQRWRNTTGSLHKWLQARSLHAYVSLSLAVIEDTSRNSSTVYYTTYLLIDNHTHVCASATSSTTNEENTITMQCLMCKHTDICNHI